MGYGPIINGKQHPITPYKGSWAARNVTKEEDAILRGALLRSGTVIHPKPAPQPAQREP